MELEKEQVEDTFIAARRFHESEDWKPGDPYMDEYLGNIRFLCWCKKFEKQIREICDKCPCQIHHKDIWLNEDHTEGIPSNKICVMYPQIKSCYDTLDVAKTCKFINKEIFHDFINEMTGYNKNL